MAISQRFTDQLENLVDSDTANWIASSAKKVVFDLWRRYAWFQACEDMIVRHEGGYTNLVDEVATELYMQWDAGLPRKEAFSKAANLVQNRLRREYNWRGSTENSIEQGVEFVRGHTSDQAGTESIDPADVFEELKVFDTPFHEHGEWGPKHMQAAKLLSRMTDKQAEAIREYAATRFKLADAAGRLGLSSQAMYQRLVGARKRAEQAVDSGLVEQRAVRI